MALKPEDLKRYLGILDSSKNEADLTDEELQQRLEAMQGIGEGGVQREINTGVVMDTVRGSLQGSGLTQGEIETAANTVAQYLHQNPGTTYIKDFQDVSPDFNPNHPKWGGGTNKRAGQIGQALNNTVKDNINQALTNEGSGIFAQTTHAGYKPEDTKRIQDLLGTRANQRAQEGATEGFLSGLPDELSSSREDFLGGETSRAVGAYQDYVPRALSGLNNRGMLYSGDVQDELSSRAFNVESALESERVQAEAEDNQFYADAAYQNQLRKSLQSNADYGSAIESERQRILTERSNRFNTYQTGLDTTLDEQLTRSDADRKLALDKQKLDAQAAASKKAQKGQLFGELGGLGGTIIGSAVGGPVGGYVGGQAGKTAGETVSDSSVPERIG